MKVTLDGDGGFTYHHHQDVHQQLIFKPVSVQALWTVIQTLHMIGERLRPVNNNPEEDDWIHEYKGKFIKALAIGVPSLITNAWKGSAVYMRPLGK